MKSLRRKSIFLLLVLLTSAHAGEAKKKVIDVGDIEVEGEVRKPFVQYLDADQGLNSMLSKVSRQKLVDYENKLLEFAKPGVKSK